MNDIKWLTPEEFFERENSYRNGQMKENIFKAICEKYKIVGIVRTFVPLSENMRVPNFVSVLHKVNEEAFFIDHCYSFKDENGNIYWVSCPYNCGKSMEKVRKIFEKAYIPCDIYPGFYAHYTIVMNAKYLSDIDYRYFILNDEKTFEYKKDVFDFDGNTETLEKFDSEAEAVAFQKGLKLATEYWINKINN